MSLKSIDASIKRIVTNAAKLNGLIHDTAVAIIEHANEHGDCSRAQHLVNAMPASMRRTMLVLWFSTYTPIVTKADQPTWDAKMHKPGTKLFVEWNIEGAKATPFHTLAEQNPEGKVYDFAALVAMFERLGKTIEKKIEDGRVATDDVDSAKLIVDTIKATRFERAKSTPANDPNKVTLPPVGEPMNPLRKVANA